VCVAWLLKKALGLQEPVLYLRCRASERSCIQICGLVGMYDSKPRLRVNPDQLVCQLCSTCLLPN